MQTQAILDAATTVSIIATDLNGIIRTFNVGAQKMLGYSADELVGKCSPSVFHFAPEVESRSAELSRKFGRPITGFDVFVECARYRDHEEREWTYVRRDGTHIKVNLVVTAQYDVEGVLTGFQGIATDITIRKRQEKELQELTQHFSQLALVDSLTGIANRRSVLERLHTTWDDLVPRDSLSVILLDIDHFKRINDVYGHDTGDQVLRSVADTIRSSIRLVDFCGRYGGEEFIIVCPATKEGAAAEIGERMRRAIEERCIQLQDGSAITVTASLGVAGHCDTIATVKELISIADSRMYVAKSQGRNRTIAM